MSWYHIDATKVRIVGGGSVVKKPKDGILGTVRYVAEGESGKDRRLSKLDVCMYVRICRMHASLSTLRFSLDISIFWMGPIYYSPYLLAILAVYDNRNCGCFEEWSLCGCMGWGEWGQMH